MSPVFLYLYVFLTGAAVMSIEMSASRLLAPYFGTSLMVWANIIGIILLAMSAGYFVGGRLADKRPVAKTLFSLTLVAGLLLTAIPFISEWFFHFLTGGILATPVHIVLLAFAGTLLVFSPPIFLLAMVSPYALRLSAPAAAETGKIAGRLYSFSTLGSIIGTFLPSFWLIPTIGTRATILLSAFVILALAACGLKRWWAVLAALLPLILLWFSPQVVKANPAVLWEKETPYQFVQVVQQPDQSIALVYNEGGGVQSLARPNHGLAAQDYFDYYLPLPFLRGEKNPNIWILGSAGGTMLGQFDHWVRPSLPGLSLTGVEIDPDVIPLGQRFFGLTGQEGTVINADARTFLNSQTGKADVIIVDAYSNQIYIPFYLSTQEFYQQVQAHLTRGGIMALNVNALSPTSKLLESFEKTLASVFLHTYILPVPGSLNYVLLASAEPIQPLNDPGKLSSGPSSSDKLSSGSPPASKFPSALLPFYQAYVQNLKPGNPSGGLLLTDDRAPVEFLTDQMIWQTLFNTLSSCSGEAKLPDNSVPESGNPSEQSSPQPPRPDTQGSTASPPAVGSATADSSGAVAGVSSAASGSSTPSTASTTEKQRESLDLYERGLKLYYARNYDQALQLFDQALALNPGSYQSLNGKGAAYAFEGRYDEGLALIKQALTLDPSYEYAQFNLGLANELAGRWNEAISAYQRAIQLDPKDTWAYFGIASIYGRQDNVEKVIEYLKPAIALNPDAKAVAWEEQDFAPVRGDSRFQALVKPR